MKILVALVAVLGLSVAHAGKMAEKDIIDTAELSGKFNTLLSAIETADMAEVLKGEGPFTVLAPSDDAFAALPEGTLEDLLAPENKDKLTEILKLHVIEGKVMAADMSGKTTIEKEISGGKNDLMINGKAGVRINDAQVVQADILASNGVIHKIDKVILPSS